MTKIPIPFFLHCYLVANGQIFSWHTKRSGGVDSNEYPGSNPCIDLKCKDKCGKEKDKEYENCIQQQGIQLTNDPGSIWIPHVLVDCCIIANAIINYCDRKVGCGE